MQNDTIFDQVVKPKEDETREVNGIMLVDSLNGIDNEDEEMEKIQEKVGNKKEDNIIILGQSPLSVITFKPLNRISREEVGPLLRVMRFENIGFQNIGAQLNGPARGIKEINGDRNCYFQAVSFSLAGNEEWHNEIRETICDYIRFWPGKLQSLLKGSNGWECMRKSEMYKSGTWATEVEILATAKCLTQDVFTFYGDRWHRYAYKAELNNDATYLDNRVGNHFNAVLYP